MDKQLLRIIDANLNRSREALRVCEEVMRFMCDCRSNAGLFKKMRHDITTLMKQLPITYGELLKSRNSHDDVGNDMVIFRNVKTSAHELFVPNMKRAQESLRVLEECTKGIAPRVSQGFQRLRFRLYESEKKLGKVL